MGSTKGYQVSVRTEAFGEQVRLLLESSAEELELDLPAEWSDPAVVRSGLSARAAQALRRKLNSLGLAAEVHEVEELPTEPPWEIDDFPLDEVEEPPTESPLAGDDLALDEPSTESPLAVDDFLLDNVSDAGNSDDPTGESGMSPLGPSVDLLSWFPDEDDPGEPSEYGRNEAVSTTPEVSERAEAPSEEQVPSALPAAPSALPAAPSALPAAPSALPAAPSVAEPVSFPTGQVPLSASPMQSPELEALERTSLSKPPRPAFSSSSAQSKVTAPILAVVLVGTVVIAVGIYWASNRPMEEWEAVDGGTEAAPPVVRPLPMPSDGSSDAEDVAGDAEEDDSDRLVAEQLFNEGLPKCMSGESEECRATMQAVITLDPTHRQAYEWLVRAQTALDENSDAKDSPSQSHPEEESDATPEVIVITPDSPRPHELADAIDAPEEPNAGHAGPNADARGGTIEDGTMILRPPN